MHHKSFFAIIIVSVTIAIFAPMFLGRGDVRLLTEIFLVLTLAQLWNLLAGYGGLVSVGQHAFVGAGAYAFFVLCAQFGVHVAPALLFAGFVSGCLAIGIYALVSRLVGPYFSIGTWVVAEIVFLAVLQTNYVGGASGFSLPLSSIREFGAAATTREYVIYATAGIMCFGVLSGNFLFLRSRFGLALTAIRDDVAAAHSVGINSDRIKFILFTSVAVLTGLVGSIIFVQNLRVSPSAAFSMQEWTATIILIVVIGGIGRFEGPLVGAMFYFALRELLAPFGSVYIIVTGIVAILIIIVFPDGLSGNIAAISRRWLRAVRPL
ncbi:branched-chain amino acid ABC transporter permease [uncultured Tateyamaria sp.]|uniref:branched-chain amino acid ABC transporter permease n=1 Tax=uncultured Tateyamaria sp. TaxID=455651 RepID=UPI00263891A9|nr:branched-chain amino acid ABC transporter permease [uncultured Tateyamaria sp.]